MAWSRPANVVAGAQIAAATTNAILADLDLLGNASSSYGSGSSWTAAGSNPVLNNGTWFGRVRQDNKCVDFQVVITMGSSTTFGSGAWSIDLPVPAKNANWTFSDGWATDASGADWQIIGRSASTTVINLSAPSTSAFLQNVQSNQPFTWAVNDVLRIKGRYEAA